VAAVPDDEPPLTPDDEQLLERLREWRRAQADERAVPAYVIFDNKTLRGIVRSRPGSLDALSEVKGVGVTKLETYGAEILALVEAAVAGVEDAGDVDRRHDHADEFLDEPASDSLDAPSLLG
jgi:superfamily II DNA helicase RecQ